MERDEDNDERLPCTLVPEGDKNTEEAALPSHKKTAGEQRTFRPKQTTQHDYEDLQRHDTTYEPTQSKEVHALSHSSS